MRDIPSVTFLGIIDAFAVAMLVVLLSGCVTTPATYRDRTGDFVSNVASAAGTIPPAPTAISRVPVACAVAASIS